MKFLIVVASTVIILSTAMPAQASYSDSKYRMQNQKVFVFYPRELRWVAYENGRKIKSGVANGGKPGYKTPSGVFYIYSKNGVNHVSSKYPLNSNGTRGGAKMPYAMHFTKAGHAIHGSPQISNQNSSHGCIRVKTKYAKWLNEEFMTRNTKVIVYPY